MMCAPHPSGSMRSRRLLCPPAARTAAPRHIPCELISVRRVVQIISCVFAVLPVMGAAWADTRQLWLLGRRRCVGNSTKCPPWGPLRLSKCNITPIASAPRLSVGDSRRQRLQWRCRCKWTGAHAQLGNILGTRPHVLWFYFDTSEGTIRRKAFVASGKCL